MAFFGLPPIHLDIPDAMAGIFIIRSSLGRSWIALWMCGVFFAYRLALLAYPHTTCSCFGRLSDWIGVEDSSLERIQLGALIYIFLGAALALWIERNVGRAQPAPAAKSHPTE